MAIAPETAYGDMVAQKKPAPKKPTAPTSGVVPNFTPTVKMPAPVATPGSAAFIGPVATTPAVKEQTGPDYGPIPYGTPVPGFTPEYDYPKQTTKPGETGFVGPVAVTTDKTDKDNIDAFAMLVAQLRQWNLDSLADTFISLATQGFKPQEAMNKIKYDTTINPATNKPWNADYTKRFSGNAARIKQGLNTYSEAEYLDIENSYADTLRRNNLNNLLSTDSAANQTKFASYMEKGLSATEFADRIDEVSTRVLNMDPNIKKQFTAYYPGVNNSDIISYVLDPENTMPVLKTKITAAEIGASAMQVGLAATSKGMAETLAQSGVTKDEAKIGYQEIGGFLSDAELYSQIYKQEGINYNQETAEKDILLGQADATKKRKRLASLERAAFEGSSGRMRTGQSQTNSGMF